MTSDGATLARVRRRYRWLAPVYDLDPGERLLYAKARGRAIELLGPSRGAAVLDVACGTGRNLPLLWERVGPAGRVVGVDLSAAMLDRARARVERHGWGNVQLLEMDAAELSAERLDAAGALGPGERFDAAISTLGLSAIPGWERALDAMLGLLRPGGRITVMDGGYPERAGEADEVVALRPFAWLICRLAAADGRSRPWLRLSSLTQDSRVERFTWGYVGVAAGTKGPRT